MAMYSESVGRLGFPRTMKFVSSVRHSGVDREKGDQPCRTDVALDTARDDGHDVDTITNELAVARKGYDGGDEGDMFS